MSEILFGYLEKILHYYGYPKIVFHISEILFWIRSNYFGYVKKMNKCYLGLLCGTGVDSATRI